MRIRNRKQSVRAKRDAENIAKRRAAEALRMASVNCQEYETAKPVTNPKSAGKRKINRNGRVIRLHVDALEQFDIRLELGTITLRAMRDIARARHGHQGSTKKVPVADYISPYCFVPKDWRRPKFPADLKQSDCSMVCRSVFDILWSGVRPNKPAKARHSIDALETWRRKGQALLLPSNLPHLDAIQRAFPSWDIVIY